MIADDDPKLSAERLTLESSSLSEGENEDVQNTWRDSDDKTEIVDVNSKELTNSTEQCIAKNADTKINDFTKLIAENRLHLQNAFDNNTANHGDIFVSNSTQKSSGKISWDDNVLSDSSHSKSIKVDQQSPPIDISKIQTDPTNNVPQVSSIESNCILLKSIFGLDLDLKKQNIYNNNVSSDAIKTSKKIDTMSRINIKRKNKNVGNSLFTELHLIQSIHIHQGAIWAMKFSHCGMYLCTVGEDKQVIVWSIGPDFFVNEYRQRLDSFVSSHSQAPSRTHSRNNSIISRSSDGQNINNYNNMSIINDKLGSINMIPDNLSENTNNNNPSELSSFMISKEKDSEIPQSQSTSIDIDEFKDDQNSNSSMRQQSTESFSQNFPEKPTSSSSLPSQCKPSDFDFIQKTPYRIFTGIYSTTIYIPLLYIHIYIPLYTYINNINIFIVCLISIRIFHFFFFLIFI